MSLVACLNDKVRDFGMQDAKIDVSVTLDKDNFKKVDEDMFYRYRAETKGNGEYIPSDGKIVINYENINLTIEDGETAEKV